MAFSKDLSTKPYLLITVFCLLSPLISEAQNCDSASAKKVECRSYYANDQTKAIRKYKHGQRHGIWVEFTKEGLFKKRTKYRKGQQIWQIAYRNETEKVITNRKGETKVRKSCGCR